MAGPLTEGLIAHYPMNDLQGDMVKDVSPQGRDAMANVVEVVEGRGGRVFAFDGQKSEMFLPDEREFEITGDYGVSFWIRGEAGDVVGGPIYSQPGFTIANFKGNVRVTVRHPEYPNTGYADLMGPSINDGEWHHVVFSYTCSTGDAVLFLDGQEAGSRLFPHKPEVSAPTTVGFAGRSHLKGELSDLRVYSRALGVDDVAALNSVKPNE
jgi:hypothetical protein